MHAFLVPRRLRLAGVIAVGIVAMLTANAFWLSTGHERFMAINAFFEHLGLIAGLVVVTICAEKTQSRRISEY